MFPRTTTGSLDRNMSPLSLHEKIPRSWLPNLCPSDVIRYGDIMDIMLRDFPTLIGSQEEIIFVLCYADGRLRDPSPNFHWSIFMNARMKLERRETAPEIVIHLMTLVCYARSYCLVTTTNEPHYRSFINDFNAFLGHGYIDTMVLTLEKMLTSLYRVVSAEDFPARDERLANFIFRIGIRNSLLRLNDPHSDLYWGDRISADSVDHQQAFRDLCLVVENSSSVGELQIHSVASTPNTIARRAS